LSWTNNCPQLMTMNEYFLCWMIHETNCNQFLPETSSWEVKMLQVPKGNMQTHQPCSWFHGYTLASSNQPSNYYANPIPFPITPSLRTCVGLCYNCRWKNNKSFKPYFSQDPPQIHPTSYWSITLVVYNSIISTGIFTFL